MQRLMFIAVRDAPKPLTFAELVESVIAAGGYNGTFAMWRENRAGIERSMRRAVHRLVETTDLIAINGDKRGLRYCLNPASGERFRAALNGNYEAARALAISIVRRVRVDGDVPPTADVITTASAILNIALQQLERDELDLAIDSHRRDAEAAE